MLTRRERTEVLVESGPALALELAGLVEADTPAEDIVPAHQGLVMCQVRETARNSRFYLSEVLVTESRVRIGEADGLGVLMRWTRRLPTWRSLSVASKRRRPRCPSTWLHRTLEPMYRASSLTRCPVKT